MSVYKRLPASELNARTRVKPASNIYRFRKRKYANGRRDNAAASADNALALRLSILASGCVLLVCGLYLLGRGAPFLGWTSLGAAGGAVLFPFMGKVLI